MLVHETNLFVEKENLFENYIHYDSTEKGNGAIFTCAGFSVAVVWSQHYVYVFDSHSRNSNGFHNPNGKAILLKFCSINSLNNYVKGCARYIFASLFFKSKQIFKFSNFMTSSNA